MELWNIATFEEIFLVENELKCTYIFPLAMSGHPDLTNFKM